MIDTSKYINIINNKNNKNNKQNKYINKLFILLLLFLFNIILMKHSNKYNDFIYEKVFNNNFSFVRIKEFYNKYLGGIEILDKKINNTKPVFNESLVYTNKNKYYDGVKLDVSNSYLVPSIEEGMVVFIGEKEHYDNTIIVEGIDGILYWYGNMLNTNVKLYDYIDKGSLLGEVKNNKLYIVYSKDNKYLDYNDYLS